jgi:hypothetical protein
LFRLPLEYARADLGWPAKRFDRAFAELKAHGLIEYDHDAQVCLIVDALTLRSPQNPNQVKAAIRAIEELPAANGLLNRFRTLAATHSDRLAEALTERFGQPLAERAANTPTPTPTHSSDAVRSTGSAATAATSEDHNDDGPRPVGHAIHDLAEELRS